jgi:hypothetical protein
MQARGWLVSWLFVVGCGDKQADAPASAPSAPPVAAPAAGGPSAATPPAPGAPAVAAAPATATPDLGTCVLRGTGAATFEQTTEGGAAAVNTWRWRAAVEHPNLGPFMLSCKGAQAAWQIVAKNDKIEFGPKRYAYGPGNRSGLMMTTTIGGQIMGFPEGVIDITAFDHAHIAGTITLTGKLGTNPVTLAGTFDYKCPASLPCGK